ncbi:uncharacterized protein L969DRAFT_49917 [Mixia osmundae IAM 14324]|uniref:Uncharacterized protein n=1 Tax=Mixia osmundae (strain CBS 9802 / IAM 14324 / JCM 22182 / KY 12970) TaxID=764103 RepID=G7E187_MIXOS|nr:uncharacterized protein L969DRAFT_49917 [Mixia osmundae IAM 14324]KEI38764.1 hypothetical protein L969DRAFT_49917 [Mixia osmundae IAM 14324]GAA96597.1 hypothetical protein E5Q_03267 [Mixia osmundae IAM 14324]
MMVPAAFIFSLASLISAARIDTKPIEARDANRLVHRHNGPYTWCGIKIELPLAKDSLALQWSLKWNSKSGTYQVNPEGIITSAKYNPSVIENGQTTINPSLAVSGQLDDATKDTFDVLLQLQIAHDGNIEAAGLVQAKYNGVAPANMPSYRFQCSDDPKQANKYTIPVIPVRDMYARCVPG